MHRSFYYIRHGQTDWNATGRLQGHSDVPLNATGRAQAEAAARRLIGTPIDHIIASDLSRAHETALIIGAALGKTVIADPALREKNFGVLEGMTREEIESRPQHELRTDIMQIDGYYLPHKGEHYDDLLNRVRSAITRHLNERSGHVLFVSHGSVFRTITRTLLPASQASENAVPYHFNFNGTWTLREI